MSWFRGTQAIAAVLALGLLGCGAESQSPPDTASAAQESPQPKESSEPMESGEPMAEGNKGHGSHNHGSHDHGAMEPFVIPDGDP
ncbi:MAG: hypothetical protein ACFCBU_04965, partial [Cyanophyceae cyanobacterium]